MIEFQDKETPRPPLIITKFFWPEYFVTLQPRLYENRVVSSYLPFGLEAGVLGLIFVGYVSLTSQSPYPIIVCSVANYLYFSFCPLSINYRTIHKENKIILSRRGAHLGRLILSPLVKLYIMTAKKKKGKSIDIILRTIIDPILVTFGQICNFRDPLLSHFLFMYLPYIE